MLSSLTLDLVATIFLVVGSFRSENKVINYRFIDPCQYAQLSITKIEDLNYTLYSD